MKGPVCVAATFALINDAVVLREVFWVSGRAISRQVRRRCAGDVFDHANLARHQSGILGFGYADCNVHTFGNHVHDPVREQTLHLHLWMGFQKAGDLQKK